MTLESRRAGPRQLGGPEAQLRLSDREWSRAGKRRGWGRAESSAQTSPLGKTHKHRQAVPAFNFTPIHSHRGPGGVGGAGAPR